MLVALLLFGKKMLKFSLQTGFPYGLFRDLFSNSQGVRERGEPAMVLVRFEFCLLFHLTDLSPCVIA